MSGGRLILAGTSPVIKLIFACIRKSVHAMHGAAVNYEGVTEDISKVNRWENVWTSHPSRQAPCTAWVTGVLMNGHRVTQSKCRINNLAQRCGPAWRWTMAGGRWFSTIATVPRRKRQEWSSSLWQQTFEKKRENMLDEGLLAIIRSLGDKQCNLQDKYSTITFWSGQSHSLGSIQNLFGHTGWL